MGVCRTFSHRQEWEPVGRRWFATFFKPSAKHKRMRESSRFNRVRHGKRADWAEREHVEMHAALSSVDRSISAQINRERHVCSSCLSDAPLTMRWPSGEYGSMRLFGWWYICIGLAFVALTLRAFMVGARARESGCGSGWPWDLYCLASQTYEGTGNRRGLLMSDFTRSIS